MPLDGLTYVKRAASLWPQETSGCMPYQSTTPEQKACFEVVSMYGKSRFTFSDKRKAHNTSRVILKIFRVTNSKLDL